MARKNMDETLANADCEDALELAKNLLKALKAKKAWTKRDEQNLNKLTKIVAILSKLVPLEKRSFKKNIFDSEADKQIIERFLSRKR